MASVRVRFAPSPTGHLHIGNARTAIINWIFAKKTGGTFILRIEDTDIERSTETLMESIFEDLKWLGLDWQEGPEVGGEFGPYRQSERLEIYRQHLDILKSKELAYPCFCTSDELEEKSKEAKARGKDLYYDRKCLNLPKQEKSDFEKAGRKPVWRFYVSPGGIEWQEPVKGTQAFDGGNFGDFVIMRSDGIPTYNFAAVVDDTLMQISHVIRSDDHVSNTPKQILLYRALGFELPQFVHIPMILGPDLNRLSKQHGATPVGDYKAKGYLPEVLINFLSLLGCSSQSEQEFLPIEKLVSEFDFSRMSKSPAIFDTAKLNWMNGNYILALELDELISLATPFLESAGIDPSDRGKLENIFSIIKKNVECLGQIPELVKPFYRDSIRLTDGQAIALYSKDVSQKIYWAFLRYLQSYDHLDAGKFIEIMKLVQKETGIMGKDLWAPIRVALTGQIHGPELPKTAEILGKEKCEGFVRELVD